MKKKGLIIATIVMVLVLAVSLTTATYAWFTVANVTTIEGFNVSVVPGTDVNIGVKKNNTYEKNPNTGMFYYGEVEYTPAAAGTLGLGTWGGTNANEGLGASINHNIVWGEQNLAVGVTTESTLAAATTGNTGLWSHAGGKTVIAANGENHSSIDVASDSAHLAVANINGEDAGDYAYFFLGVQPSKELKTNNLVILLDASENATANVGILSAIHVAYRVNGGAVVDSEYVEGAWYEVDLCGDDVHYDSALSSLTLSLTGTAVGNAYGTSYSADGGKTPATLPTKGAYHEIELDGTAMAIEQVEIVIYIAGADSDCVNGALNGAKGSIKIFFATEAQA